MTHTETDEPRRFRLIEPRCDRGRPGCYFPSMDAHVLAHRRDWQPGEPEICEWLDDEPGDPKCQQCGRPIAVIHGSAGGVQIVDPPVFDEHLGWICRPHLCRPALEAARAALRGGILASAAHEKPPGTTPGGNASQDRHCRADRSTDEATPV